MANLARAGEGERDRESGVGLGELLAQEGLNGGAEILRYQHVEEQSPVVVARHLVIEPENLRPGADACRSMRKTGPATEQQRADHIVVEAA